MIIFFFSPELHHLFIQAVQNMRGTRRLQKEGEGGYLMRKDLFLKMLLVLEIYLRYTCFYQASPSVAILYFAV